MRRQEDYHVLKTRIFERHSQPSVPCGRRRASEMTLVVNSYVSECRVRLLCPIPASLPLAHLSAPCGLPSPHRVAEMAATLSWGLHRV
jgi:hypothetical protein